MSGKAGRTAGGSPFLFRWREALFASDLPPTTRHVLLTLSTYGDDRGREIFPQTRTLASATGLVRRTVEGRLREADEGGWIRRAHIGQGFGWKRIRYELCIPKGGVGVTPPAPEEVEQELHHPNPERGAFDAQRGASDDTKVEQGLPLTSPMTSPRTSPYPPEAADAGPKKKRGKRGGEKPTPANWVSRAGEVWSARLGGTAPHGRIGKALKPLVEEHGAGEVVRVLDSYLESHVKDGDAQFATPENLAQRFGIYAKGTPKRKGRGYVDPAADIDYHKLLAELETTP